MTYKIKYERIIKRSNVRSNPNYIYVFGDNDKREGYGGQAKEMRGEPNAIGIRVKKSPSMSQNSFYTDNEYEENIRKISIDLSKLEQKSYNKTIVFPENGIGTGLAMLYKTAPKTFIYLCYQLYSKFNIKNGNVNYKPHIIEKGCGCK